MEEIDLYSRLAGYGSTDLRPQHGRVARAIGPIVRAGRERGSNDAARAEEQALHLSRSLNDLPGRVARALVSQDGDPEGVVEQVRGQVSGLTRLMETLSWKDPSALELAKTELAHLDRLLQWEQIESKVVE